MGAACQMLEVNEATLRRWADRSLVRSYRTPGGHRRFSRDDLQSLLEGTLSLGDGDTSHDVANAALRHIRRRMRSRSATHQPWYEQIQEESRGRMRLFGYRLLTLATDYLSRRGRRPELLAEARLVGEEYGIETARLGLPLEDGIQAFVFFRNSLVEGLQEAGTSDASPRAVYLAWQQVNTVTDEVLQGIVVTYQRAGSGVVEGQGQ